MNQEMITIKRYLTVFILLLLIPSASANSLTLKEIGSFRVDNIIGINDLADFYIVNDYIFDHSVDSSFAASIMVYEFTDPINPEYKSVIDNSDLDNSDTIGYANVVGHGDYFYLTSSDSTNTDGWKHYLNVFTNPENPSLVTDFELGDFNPVAQYYLDDSIYMVDGGNISRIDVSDPSNPEFMAFTIVFDDNGNDVHILGVRDGNLLLQYAGSAGYYLTQCNAITLEYASHFKTSSISGGIMFGDYYISQNTNVIDLTSNEFVDISFSIDWFEEIGSLGSNYFYGVNDTTVEVYDSNLVAVSSSGDYVDLFGTSASYNSGIDGYYIFAGDRDADKTFVLEFSTRVIDTSSESNSESITDSSNSSSPTGLDTDTSDAAYPSLVLLILLATPYLRRKINS